MLFFWATGRNNISCRGSAFVPYVSSSRVLTVAVILSKFLYLFERCQLQTVRSMGHTSQQQLDHYGVCTRHRVWLGGLSVPRQGEI
jgi:hypothetical protein